MTVRHELSRARRALSVQSTCSLGALLTARQRSREVLRDVDRDRLHQYRRLMPELIAPTVRLQSAWLEAHEEWGPGVHEDGFGLLPSDDVDSPNGFAAWVTRLAAESDSVTEQAPRVSCIYRWIVEGDRVLGGIALRHGLDDAVLETGHIGYGIRPSARRRGLAGWALDQILDEARSLGLARVLLVCAIDNVASAKTIVRHGGILESIRDTMFGAARRYWIKIQ